MDVPYSQENTVIFCKIITYEISLCLGCNYNSEFNTTFISRPLNIIGL
jgi:hypothetical protein